MYSMTGFGRGEYKEGGIELVAEVKTVNNRYLDISVKCPKIFLGYEDTIRGIVRSRLTRGHADVFISFTDKRPKQRTLYIDDGAAGAYVEAAERLSSLFPKLLNDFTVTALMRQPDVVRAEETAGADEELIAALRGALESALDKLNVMRATEGEKLARDMLARVDAIERSVAAITERAPLVAEEYKNRLAEKVQSYLENVPVDEGRLLTEVAVFTDKANIDEELTRLGSHISQFRAICADELVGRKLDFLIQEFNRETNTICSKSNDLQITKLGLGMKNDIEKIREQVQNVE